MIARLLNTLLGPKCPRCRDRVYPRDHTLHDRDCT